MKKLPFLGLGLSTNLNAADEPHPYRLLDEQPGLFDFVEYSAPLSLQETKAHASLFEEMLQRREEVPALFHPVHLNLYGPELEEEQALKNLRDHASAIASAWVGNDVGWWHSRGQPFPGYLYLVPPFNEAGLADCVRHAQHVQAALDRPLALENPVVMTQRGRWHVLDFMARLHGQTGCPLILDVGHLYGHQLVHGHSPHTGFDGFPFEQVIELHLAGGLVLRKESERAYADDHTQPIREEVFGLLENILPRCPNLRALTLEADGQPRHIAALTLRRLRPWVKEAAEKPPIGHSRNQPAGGLPDQSRPWELFEETFAPVTTTKRLEEDYRLAVLASELDGAWPATRLLVAPDGAGLRAFSRSPELRAHFENGPSAQPWGLFGSYARRLVRERKDEVASAVVAFETWAHALHKHRTPRLPEEVGWANGVFLAQFPVNLSELYFGVRALKRHLLSRGWASGEVDLSALDALRQLAARPSGGPWSVLVLKSPGKLGVESPSPGLVQILQIASEGVAWEAFVERLGSTEKAREAVAAGWITVGP